MDVQAQIMAIEQPLVPCRASLIWAGVGPSKATVIMATTASRQVLLEGGSHGRSRDLICMRRGSVEKRVTRDQPA